jgi:glutaredoxin-like protein
MMTFLTDKDKNQIRKTFDSLDKKVQLIHFTQELECQYCPETKKMLEELSELSDKIDLTIFNFQIEKEMVEKFKVDKVPATVVMGEKDFGIRYYGIPSGYEFSSLIEDIVDVSKGESGLLAGSKELLAKIKNPIQLQVFVTTTCPHCPIAVRLAHKLAIENDNITADMIEATEFPHLSMRYNVKGVPKTMIGEDTPIEGALPELDLIEKIVEVHNKNNI